MDPLPNVPSWILRPLPVNAINDASLHARIDSLAAELPRTLRQIADELAQVISYREYDSAANRAASHIWPQLQAIFASSSVQARMDLLAFAHAHLAPKAQARIYRRLVKDPTLRVRRRAARLIEKASLHEVALPLGREKPWDATGWLKNVTDTALSRHKTGRRAQEKSGVPVLANLGQLRELLEIRSPRQLGWLLLATDTDGGPYVKFTIPKRGGGDREICSPKKQLRWVQRRILARILDQVAPHKAAHGFVPGRSTVTNAAVHCGAALLVKFDLTNFFPTIHYHRVVGLFARLGYGIGDGKFGTADKAAQLAPTLARLCCYTADARDWHGAALPQGAPTSPAITNLVCRRLDARLDGLARRNAGKYTRYADDPTFSFSTDHIELGRLRWWVDQICHQEGFFVNQEKYRVIRASQRQVVTGIVVNDELRVPREARRRFRAMLHNCRRDGVETQARGHPFFADYLRGFASYINMVHPEEGADLLAAVRGLVGDDMPGDAV
jgi:RNA-directed DNA polymerase